MYVAYDTTTGEIQRTLVNAANINKHNAGPGHEWLEVDDDTNLTGKMVDPATESLVDDPDHDPPLDHDALAQDLRDGTVTVEEALLQLLEN